MLSHHSRRWIYIGPAFDQCIALAGRVIHPLPVRGLSHLLLFSHNVATAKLKTFHLTSLFFQVEPYIFLSNCNIVFYVVLGKFAG